MIWILFYYNSLPDMPEGCILFSPEVMHRDFFKCNPYNTGHYQYPQFETLSYDEGCHYKEVNNFLKKADGEKYVVFYTRHTNLEGTFKNKVIGFFKVGDCFVLPKKGFCASDKVLLPKNQSIKINYYSRGVPVSWGSSPVRNKIFQTLTSLRKNNGADISSNYKTETQNMMKRLQNFAGRKQIIDICENCNVKKQCYWGKCSAQNKEKKLKILYDMKASC
ncbi:MAG: hypothetical protein WC637_05070 [Victivallales bacterium]|jgi:hypothetical protein